MHYYQFNIADYRKDTVHLIPIEHYIYRTLIDWYYLDELEIPKKTQMVLRRLQLGTEHEANLLNVLNDFFVETENGWLHKRIDVEIKDYVVKCDKNKLNGKKGGRPKKTQSVLVANQNESELNPNHKPITNNHKPVLKEKINKKENLLFDVDEEIANDFIQLRKQKKAPLTKTAVDGIRREADKAGITLQDALKECCTRGWQGFKAEWLKNNIIQPRQRGSPNFNIGKQSAIEQQNAMVASSWVPPELRKKANE